MSVWDDEARERRPGTDIGSRHAVATPLRRKTYGDVRTAAERDAAEIIARARRDIRRIVSDARHELLELAEQVKAAEMGRAEPPQPPAPPPAAPPPPPPAPEPAAHAAPPQDAAAAPETASTSASPEPPPTVSYSAYAEPPAVPTSWPAMTDDEPSHDGDAVALPDYYAEPTIDRETALLPREESTTNRARTFVALFTAIGLVFVAGTLLWVSRRPATRGTDTPAYKAATEESSLSAAEAIATANPLAAPNSPPPESLALSLEAERETWVRVIVDGAQDFGHTYTPGESRKIAGAREVLVRAGDAGGLMVSIDGAPAAPFGPDGVTLTRRFTRKTATGAADTKPAPATPPAAAPAAPPATTPAPAPPPVASAPPATPQPTARPSAPATVATPAAAAPTAAAPTVTAPPRPSVPAPAAVVPAPAPNVAAAPAPPRAAPARVDIAASGRQWLDAYHRQDRTDIEALSAPSLMINDERRPTERFPFGLEVARAFEDEQLTLAGDSAQFTARMTERAATGAFSSRVTQTWVRRQGVWQLQEARIIHDTVATAGR